MRNYNAFICMLFLSSRIYEQQNDSVGKLIRIFVFNNNLWRKEMNSEVCLLNVLQSHTKRVKVALMQNIMAYTATFLSF